MYVEKFNWQILGKPDYAQAAAIIASLPQETRWKLKDCSRELLTRVLHLSWLYAMRSGRNRGYCWPTQSTLAKWCNKSVRTVEYHLHVLRDLGLLDWKRRWKKNGAWTSNLYKLGKVFFIQLFSRAAKKSPVKSHTQLSANDNFHKKVYDATPEKNGGSSSHKSVTELRASSSIRLTASLARSPSEEEETKASWEQGGEGKKEDELSAMIRKLNEKYKDVKGVRS